MGIASIFASVVKGISWAKIAGAAMEYGPGLYRQALERLNVQTPPAVNPEITALQERITRLERLLLEQEGVIREQTVKNEVLEKSRLNLESRLLILQITAGALTIGCIILLAVLFQ